MKPTNVIFIFALFLLALGYMACNTRDKKPVKDPKEILSSFDSFWKYWKDEVKLSEDFVAYNENGAVIDKEFFLHVISKGRDMPLRLQSDDSVSYYKLYNIQDLQNDEITDVIKMYGDKYYQEFEMEGKPLPDFTYADLDGKTYNRENCMGKIVVINLWFIHCTSCVAEMPELNQIKNSYKDRKDIVFVSMAFDPKNKLREFLKTITFDYAVIPVTKSYVMDSLKMMSFPGHIILNKKNLVARVPEDYRELEKELKQEALK